MGEKMLAAFPVAFLTQLVFVWVQPGRSRGVGGRKGPSGLSPSLPLPASPAVATAPSE